MLDAYRQRVLAARVIAADRMHRGAAFGETAKHLKDELEFDPWDAVVIAERAYRGGGVARDVSYLAGWLRVQDAVERGFTTLSELGVGRISLSALPQLRELRGMGLVRAPLHRVHRAHVESLLRSLSFTSGGTNLDTSPPKRATSLTTLELT